MHRASGRVIGAVMVACFSLTSTVYGQWKATGIGVAEYDTEETLLLLAGVSASPGGKAWAPILGVQGYHLSYDVAGSRRNILTIRPYAGLRRNFTGGSGYGTLGYALSNRDDIAPVGAVVSDRGEGVVLSGGVDYWGTGSWGWQALASNNFGSESFWGRGRVTTRLSGDATRSTRIGAEVAFLSGTGYSAVQPGGVIEWHAPSGRIIGFGAGAKLVDAGKNAVYVRLETVLPLMR